MASLSNFKRLAANGYLNQIMAEGVADAIAKSHALGLPVEGYLNSDPAPLNTPSVGSRKKPRPVAAAAAMPRRAAA